MGRRAKERVPVNNIPVKDAMRGASMADAPPMTPALAVVFAKLLQAGCPEDRAVLYVYPHLPVEQIGPTARLWKHHKDVVAAITEANGGAWFDLTTEQRAKIAIDKSNSEAFFYLWDTNFAAAAGKDDLEKLKLARVITKEALGMAPDESDPMQAFARFALDMVRESQGAAAGRKKTPAQLQGPSLPDMVKKTTVPH
jgi:hypothetical protein